MTRNSIPTFNDSSPSLGRRLAAVALSACLPLAACGSPEPPASASKAVSPAPAAPAKTATAPEPAPEAAPTKAESPAAGVAAVAAVGVEVATLFAGRCAVCHGAEGGGDGPTAAALDPKPRAFTDAAWQASMTDEAIIKVVTEGGAAVGKSPLMPPNPDLAARPELMKALVSRIRAFGAH